MRPSAAGSTRMACLSILADDCALAAIATRPSSTTASKALGFLPGNLKCSQLAAFDLSDMAGIHDAIRKLRDSLDSTSVSGRDTQADSETIVRTDKNQAGDRTH